MRTAVVALGVVVAVAACNRRSLQGDGGAGMIQFDAASVDGGLARADVPFPGADAWTLGDVFPPVDAPSADANCGVTRAVGAYVAPEILVVLDRSVSLDPAQWNSFRSAIAAMITAQNERIDWGLYAFPMDGPACGAGTLGTAIDVSPAPYSAMLVVPHMFAAGTGASGTPTAAAIETAAAHMRARTTQNPKYLMLVTDGAPSCARNIDGLSADRAQAQVDAVAAIGAAAAAGIPTFVVAPSMITAASEVDALNALADAGRYPRPNVGSRYHTELTLGEQFVPVNSSSTCALGLQSPPPVPENVAVTFNGVTVPRDRSRMSGWDYVTPAAAPTMKVIQLYGPWCDLVQSSRSFEIAVYYGCAPLLDLGP